MIRGVQAQGRLGEGVLAQFWHSCSPNGDGRDTEPSGSALFVRKLWSHPPGSNRRPTDYESVALPAELGWPSGLRLKRSARFGTLLCDDNTMVIGPRLAVPIALAMLGSCRTPGPAAAKSSPPPSLGSSSKSAVLTIKLPNS